MEFEPMNSEPARMEHGARDLTPEQFDLEIEELEARVAFMPVDGGGGSSCASCVSGGCATCRGGTICP